MQSIILDVDFIIPQDRLLRQIKNCINFDFIYEKVATYYLNIDGKSIDPVVANIAVQSSVEVIETVHQSFINYLNEIEREISEFPVY